MLYVNKNFNLSKVIYVYLIFIKGNGNNAVNATIGVERLTRFFQWCRDNDYKAMVGETGAANN